MVKNLRFIYVILNVMNNKQLDFNFLKVLYIIYFYLILIYFIGAYFHFGPLSDIKKFPMSDFSNLVFTTKSNDATDPMSLFIVDCRYYLI